MLHVVSLKCVTSPLAQLVPVTPLESPLSRLAQALVSNTPELNRTDCNLRRPDSAEVRSCNLLRLTKRRILAGVLEEERPWERDGPDVS